MKNLPFKVGVLFSATMLFVACSKHSEPAAKDRNRERQEVLARSFPNAKSLPELSPFAFSIDSQRKLRALVGQTIATDQLVMIDVCERRGTLYFESQVLPDYFVRLTITESQLADIRSAAHGARFGNVAIAFKLEDVMAPSVTLRSEITGNAEPEAELQIDGLELVVVTGTLLGVVPL